MCMNEANPAVRLTTQNSIHPLYASQVRKRHRSPPEKILHQLQTCDCCVSTSKLKSDQQNPQGMHQQEQQQLSHNRSVRSTPTNQFRTVPNPILKHTILLLSDLRPFIEIELPSPHMSGGLSVGIRYHHRRVMFCSLLFYNCISGDAMGKVEAERPS